MSDLESNTANPLDRHSPKRRRLSAYDSEESSSRYSDETGERDGYRTSKSITRRDSAARRRSRSSDGSIDEADHAFKSRTRSSSRDQHIARSPALDDESATPPTYKPLKLNYKQKFILKGHTKGVSQVRFSPDGRWIASCSADGTIKIWDAVTGQHKRTLEGHLAGISTIAWSPDSNTLASGSDDKAIRLWHRATGKPYPAPLLGHHNYVYSLAFSPKGNMLVSGSYDEAIFLWDLRARRQMRSLPAHSDPVGGVDFIRDGTLVCSCSTDGLVRVWDTATGQCLRTLVHEDNAPVTTVRFSPNGRYILAFTLDSCIRLWDYVAGTCKKTYQGHVNKKYSLGGAFGIGGTEGFIVSGSENGEIIFWDVKTKNIIQRVTGHEGVVLWVDTSPGPSGALVSGGSDGTVRIWVDTNEPEHNINLIAEMKREDDFGEAFHNDLAAMDGMVENGVIGYDDDTPGFDGNRSPTTGDEVPQPKQDAMEED